MTDLDLPGFGKIDSIECGCGARTAVGNIGKKGKLVLFVGGAYKDGMLKTSQEFRNEAKVRCLWCGTAWSETIREAFKNAVP